MKFTEEMMSIRKIVMAVVTTVLLATALAGQALAAVPTTGLVAYYPLSGNASDASGNGHDGAATGATLAADRFGLDSNAYSFRGIQANPDYIEINSGDNTKFNFAWHAFTISAWIRIDDDFAGVPEDGGAIYGAIFDRFGTWGGYRLDYSTNTNKFRLLGNRTSLEAPATLVKGVWYHVAAISDGSFSKVYLNGVMIKTGGHWVDTNYEVPPRIGSLVTGVPWNCPFKGMIDEVSVYDRVLSPPEVASIYQNVYPAVDAGGSHTCGVKADGTVVCWGANDYGQSSPPGGAFTQVSAGKSHTCGVKADSTVVCWGANDYGQSSPPGGDFTQVSADAIHTCGVRPDGSVACWGDNTYGELNQPGGTFYTQVSAGYRYSCGVKSDFTVVCWGENGYGQSSPPGGTFTQVSAGTYIHTCGVKTGGTVACWGDNTYGELNQPGGTFTQVSAGGYYTCGVKSDGTVACWGNNTYGRLNQPGGSFTQVSAGVYHTCGVKTDGSVACWGNNNYGQAPGAVAVSPTLPDGVIGTAYSQALTAAGGLGGPYSFSVTSGSLPPGFTLSSAGMVSGTPSTPGTYSFTVRAFDNTGLFFTTQAFSVSCRQATATSVALTSGTNPSTHGDALTFTATVTAPVGTPTGTVTFFDGATPICSAVPLDANLKASCTTMGTTLGGGSHTITATYSGDTIYMATSGTVGQTVNKANSAAQVALTAGANPSSLGQPLVFTATVTSGVSTPTGTVTFMDGTTSLCPAVALDGSGQASCSRSDLTVGAHTITATYNGNANYHGSSGTVGQNVNQANSATLVALTAGTNPSSFGQALTFTATVTSGVSTPTGTVTFMDGATSLCPAVALSPGGQAVCSRSDLTAGAHAITATYGGDPNYHGSSGTVSQSVNKTNTTTQVELTSGTNPATFGQPLTFTALVTSAAGSPTGSVTFTAGAATLCSAAPLNSIGLAACSSSGLAIGAHTITATYSGNGNYNGSSAALSQTVAARPVMNVLPPVAAPASGVSNSGFTCNWGAVEGAVGYYLDVAIDPAFSRDLAGYQNRDVGNVTSVTISNLAPGQVCYYRVRAYDVNGAVSGDSNSIIVSTFTGQVSAIVIDPLNPTTLFAAVDGEGVWKKVDTGEWTPATSQPSNLRVKAVVIKPGDSTKLFAATYGGGVYVSSNATGDPANNGLSWAVCTDGATINSGLTNLNVVSLVSDGSGTLYAGTEGGVFVSSDGCATWTEMNTGLPN